MSSSVDKALEEVKKLVEEVTDPSRMSKDEYREFLDELISDLEIQREAAGE